MLHLQAKGISVEDFLRRQEEITEKFDSGFNGYRGLNGKCISHSLHRLPHDDSGSSSERLLGIDRAAGTIFMDLIILSALAILKKSLLTAMAFRRGPLPG